MHPCQINLSPSCCLKPWNFDPSIITAACSFFIVILSPGGVPSPSHGVSCSIRRNRLEYRETEGESAVASTDQTENPHEKNARVKKKSSSSRTDEQPPAKGQKDSAQNPKKVGGKGRVELENVVAPNGEPELKAKDDKPSDMSKRQMKGPSYEKNKYSDQCTAFILNLDL
ncbi:hypothetical protein CK203_073337 [Vitis vinifera]|uniref:Uncharacterized protein n=1 Tax=Vitis vinifera TaxID=29760 RepID=A0A438ESP3_VITVI|nr:hypothetical protein CK203_073337 [Vitis vinifera]